MKIKSLKTLIFVGASCLLVSVGYLDFITGTEVSFDIFYLLPICIFAFYLGKRQGIVIAVLGGVVWLGSDIFAGHYHSQAVVHYWNAGVRLSIFSIVVLLLVSLKRKQEKQKQVADELKRSYERLQVLMDQQSEFTAMVTHELRTPLVAIRESIKVIQDEMVGPIHPDQKEYLDMALRSAGRLARLVDDILDFSKLENHKKSYQMKKGDITKCLREIEKLYMPVAEKSGLSLKMKATDNIPNIYFDQDAICQVLTNLVGNALKFTEKGEILLGTRMNNDSVEVYVKDSGAGVKKEDLNKMFDPFTQLQYPDRRRQKGTGLGLTIAKLIVEQHGGAMWIDSEEGKGTTVTFILSTERNRWRRLSELQLVA